MYSCIQSIWLSYNHYSYITNSACENLKSIFSCCVSWNLSIYLSNYLSINFLFYVFQISFTLYDPITLKEHPFLVIIGPGLDSFWIFEIFFPWGFPTVYDTTTLNEHPFLLIFGPRINFSPAFLTFWNLLFMVFSVVYDMIILKHLF